MSEQEGDVPVTLGASVPWVPCDGALLTLCARQTETFIQGRLVPPGQVWSCGLGGCGQALTSVSRAPRAPWDTHLGTLTSQVGEVPASEPWLLCPGAFTLQPAGLPELRAFGHTRRPSAATSVPARSVTTAPRRAPAL